MILVLNTCFEGYTPVKVLGKSTLYREVYLAIDNSGAEVVLTVYDMNKVPGCYASGMVSELDLMPHLKNDTFQTYLEHGQYDKDNVSLRWIATKYFPYTTLTDFILSDYVRNERQMVIQFYNLLLAVKELSLLIGEGSHNNITTDNILVSNDGTGEMKWLLTGLNCVSKGSRRQDNIDTSALSCCFLAPETLVGYFNEKTDIFSLGIVLSFILQGRHPWGDFIGSDTQMSSVAMVKLMRANQPLLTMPEALKDIVSKAIAVKPSDRYKSIADFGEALANYLGNENLPSFDCFTSLYSSAVNTPSQVKPKEEESVELTSQLTPPQPKANVKIEQVKGNGFKDVAGMEKLKSKLTRNFVDIVQNRELAEQFQITPPNGILLWGPPGTGKTFISRKLAEESGMLFSLIKPSDLGNIYIHGSQSMIANLFTRSEELAAKNGCGVLLVFDEFDSLVPKREINDNNQANEVAEFLTRLNDCAEKNVFVVATTNRIDAIDPAIIRKGRMDEVIYVGLPDRDARKELLEIELLKRPHEDIDIDLLVERTQGYSASDISFIVKECARCSFEESIRSKHLVKINQTLMENIISITRPSVTGDELSVYERTNDSFIKGNHQERPRIGFK